VNRLYKSLNTLCIILTLVLLSLRADARGAQQIQSGVEAGTANISQPFIWRDPGEIGPLNLFYGGSPERGPKAPFTFVKELTAGATPKFEVADQQGVHWIAKLGEEAKSETAATRLVWAAGYFTDEAYYLPEMRVEQIQKLARGAEFVSKDGIVQGVRLEPIRDEVKRIGNWSWSDNPFVATKEMNGLRVMLALINNWDLKSANNSIYSVYGHTFYVVSDLGASFGKTGGIGSRTKSRLEDYAASKFIDDEDLEAVDLKIKSRPFFLLAVDLYHYNKLTSRENVGKNIPRSHAKWLAGLLGRLSIEQIRDCFRAAGYSPAEVDGFANVVQQRIADLNRL
jgi:hypothetical protein